MHIGQRVRNVTDGQIGFLVTTSAGTCVKLDRASQDIIIPYSPHVWLNADKPPLNEVQVAQVAFAADQALRRVNGEYNVDEWISLSDKDRIDFITNGPRTTDESRKKLYYRVVACLKAA